MSGDAELDARPAAAAAASAAQQLELQNAATFADILEQQMAAQIAAEEAVSSFSSACRMHAQNLRSVQSVT